MADLTSRVAVLEDRCSERSEIIKGLSEKVDTLEGTVSLLDHYFQKRLSIWAHVLTAVIVAVIMKLGDLVFAAGAVQP